MRPKITSRDIRFFILGIVSFFVIDIIWNWDEAVEAFNRGQQDAMEEIRSEYPDKNEISR